MVYYSEEVLVKHAILKKQKFIHHRNIRLYF